MIIHGNPAETICAQILDRERRYEELELESMQLYLQAQKNEIKLQEQQILIQQKQIEEFERKERAKIPVARISDN